MRLHQEQELTDCIRLTAGLCWLWFNNTRCTFSVGSCWWVDCVRNSARHCHLSKCRCCPFATTSVKEKTGFGCNFQRTISRILGGRNDVKTVARRFWLVEKCTTSYSTKKACDTLYPNSNLPHQSWILVDHGTYLGPCKTFAFTVQIVECISTWSSVIPNSTIIRRTIQMYATQSFKEQRNHRVYHVNSSTIVHTEDANKGWDGLD